MRHPPFMRFGCQVCCQGLAKIWYPPPADFFYLGREIGDRAHVMLCYVRKLPQASHITANLIPVSHYGLGAAALAIFRNAHVQEELSA